MHWGRFTHILNFSYIQSIGPGIGDVNTVLDYKWVSIELTGRGFKVYLWICIIRIAEPEVAGILAPTCGFIRCAGGHVAAAVISFGSSSGRAPCHVAAGGISNSVSTRCQGCSAVA